MDNFSILLIITNFLTCANNHANEEREIWRQVASDINNIVCDHSIRDDVGANVVPSILLKHLKMAKHDVVLALLKRRTHA